MLFAPDSKLYFESHVTIEPIFDERLEVARFIANKHGFKIASLLMKKRAEDTAERSQYDTFMTGHGKVYAIMVYKLSNLVHDLADNGFKIWRYKIEDTLMDSNKKDELFLLPEIDNTTAKTL
jgi:hypothetical protein